MGDLLESLVQGSQKQTILCCWGWVVTNGFRAIAQHEMGGACTIPCTRWDAKNGEIP
jgi:hypothetical protein